MKAIILFSGGLDSTVVLSLALEKGRRCKALSFDYGQKHLIELQHAKKIALHFSVEHQIIKIDSSAFSNSSLIDLNKAAVKRSVDEITTSKIPSTYVPARNTLFLAFAAGQAELYDAEEIYAGPNLLDRTAYPDCRPAFYKAFQSVLNTGTKQALERRAPYLLTPLINLDKRAIVKEGKRLNAPLHLTFSCYFPKENGTPCLECDACVLRCDALSTQHDN